MSKSINISQSDLSRIINEEMTKEVNRRKRKQVAENKLKEECHTMKLTESDLRRMISEEYEKMMLLEGFKDWWSKNILGHEPSDGKIGGKNTQTSSNQNQLPKGGTTDWSPTQNKISIRDFINTSRIPELDKAIMSTGLVGKNAQGWYVKLSQALKAGQKVVMQIDGTKYAVNQSILDMFRARYNSLYSKAPMKAIQPNKNVTAAAQKQPNNPSIPSLLP